MAFLTDNLSVHSEGTLSLPSPTVTVLDVQRLDESDEEVKKAVDQYYTQLEMPGGSSGEDDEGADLASDPNNTFLNKYLLQYRLASMRYVMISFSCSF